MGVVGSRGDATGESSAALVPSPPIRTAARVSALHSCAFVFRFCSILMSLLRGMARQSAADYAQVSAWHEWLKSLDGTRKSSATHKSINPYCIVRGDVICYGP